MLGLPLAFSAPLVLTALLALPALYYLLRLTPPRPREVSFPPLRLILDLQAQEETPARTPWWLLALRLLLAAFIILAMAGPIWYPLAASLNVNPPRRRFTGAGAGLRQGRGGRSDGEGGGGERGRERGRERDPTARLTAHVTRRRGGRTGRS
jgi:hypothetical protein